MKACWFFVRFRSGGFWYSFYNSPSKNLPSWTHLEHVVARASSAVAVGISCTVFLATVLQKGAICQISNAATDH